MLPAMTTEWDAALAAVRAGRAPVEAARGLVDLMTDEERHGCLDGDLPFWAGMADMGTGGYHKRPFLGRAQGHAHTNGAAGVKCAAGAVRQCRSVGGLGPAQRAVAAKKLRAVTGDASLIAGMQIEKCHTVGELRPEPVFCQQRACRLVAAGDHVEARPRSILPEHPLDI